MQIIKNPDISRGFLLLDPDITKHIFCLAVSKVRLLTRKLITAYPIKDWLRGPDLNRRPSGYEPDELPSCSTPRPILLST